MVLYMFAIANISENIINHFNLYNGKLFLVD